MIDRRTALRALGTLAFGVRPALAQPAGKPPRIGITVGTDAFYDVFLQALREAGWINGRNIVVERRTTLGRREQIPKLVAEVVALKLDVIVASAPLMIAAFKRATSTIPIVAIDFESYLVASGFIAGFPRPGGISPVCSWIFRSSPASSSSSSRRRCRASRASPSSGTRTLEVLQLQATRDAAQLAGLSLDPIGSAP